MSHKFARLSQLSGKISKILCRNLKTNVEKDQNKGVKYTNTINLPKTDFPARLNTTQRAETEEAIRARHLGPLYSWQRKNLAAPDYVLHDGPPYANGVLHMGHAINKILKDITLKKKILQGMRVHYKPGWDCHGLPIELKALSSHQGLSPIQVRQKARKFAEEAIKKQKESFKSWGVTGSWEDKSETYRTLDKDYIKNQLRIFFEMYQKKLIYRDLKPVYWSPSSGTALAEAELEYDENFISPSLYFRCKIENLTEAGAEVYALVWTTTPWTLPANQAICFNPDLKYSLVKTGNDFYIVGSETIQNLIKQLEADIEVVRELNPTQLQSLMYRHPINHQEILPLFSGFHVEADKGTGLVHTAPSHGPDDFLVFLAKKIPLKCLVNERGVYNESAPDFLKGKKVLDEGNELVIERLQSNVVKLGKLVHSYPIDWRTKKPVIIMASEQWFVNTDKVKSKAVEELDKVNIFPKQSSQISKNALKTQLEKRPYWCISRQRSWGVPIPVLYDVSTEKPVINEELISHWTKLIDETGSVDFWFEKDVAQLLPESFEIDSVRLKKGIDILDIWFDSGLSWSHVMNEPHVADLYLEGIDQFTGWFQSSLMTSVGVRDIAPYKNIFVHGFAVDEKGKKMSKSLGNVISPDTIVKKYGTDAIRWWVAAHSTQHSLIPVSYKLLEDGASNLTKIRATLKYLLGVIEKGTDGTINEATLTHLDKFILHKLTEFNENVDSCYENFEFNRIIAFLNNFVNTDLSRCYLHLVKDRLYCGCNREHQDIQQIFMACYRSLCRSLWPITPFLVEESWSFVKNDSFYQDSGKCQAWNFRESEIVVASAMEVKSQLYSMSSDIKAWKVNVRVEGNEDSLRNLKILHPQLNEPSSNTELCEIFQASSITLVNSEEKDLLISFTIIDENLCARCRRFSASSGICYRCENVLKEREMSSTT